MTIKEVTIYRACMKDGTTIDFEANSLDVRNGYYIARFYFATKTEKTSIVFTGPIWNRKMSEVVSMVDSTDSIVTFIAQAENVYAIYEIEEKASA